MDTDISINHTNKLSLELGSIIQIHSPTNDLLHNKIFFIDYLDDNFIRIIDDIDFNTIELNIVDGHLADKSILSISILYIPQLKGYARQNDLIPSKWIELHIGGDIPTILIGQITDLEEDMIEVKLYPTTSIIYINFDYKGMPTNIPIEKIVLREKPVEITDKQLDITDKSKEPIEETQIPIQQVNIQSIIAQGDIVFDDEELQSITQEVQIQESEKRFAIDTQTNDLLNDILSTIPPQKRTSSVLNNINTIINRFIQLRHLYSITDSNNLITGFKSKGADYKPLVDKLNNFNTKLYWLLPVVKNIKSLDCYEQDEEQLNKCEFDDFNDINLSYNNNFIKFINDFFNKEYYANNLPASTNSYDYLLNKIHNIYNIYNLPNDTSNLLNSSFVNNSFDVLIDNYDSNMKDFNSTVVKNNQLINQRFVFTKYSTGFNKLYMNIIKNKILNIDTLNATLNDSIALSSFITLPEPYYLYSNISLPSTSIYTKSNLNHIPFNYFNLFKNNLSINKTIITDLSSSIQHTNFLNNIQQFILDPSITDEDKYYKFLQQLIPKTKTIFNFVNKYITYNTSYTNIISYLEPFLIYNDDITFMQYKTIIDFIYQSILKLNKNIAFNEIESNKLRKLLLNNIFTSSLISNLLQIYKEHINTYYKINTTNLSSYELLNNIIFIDNGNYFFSLLSDLNSSLYSDIDISTIIEQIQTSFDNTKTQQQILMNKCKNLILAKKYTNIDTLYSDNDVSNVTVDLMYDTTNYDILELYEEQRSAMNDEEFEDFLKQELLEAGNISRNLVDEEVNALMNGYKLVKDGDFALLVETDDTDEFNQEVKIFKRENNTWNYDILLTQELDTVPIDDIPLYFCNKQPKELVFKDSTVESNKSKQQLIKEQTELYKNKFEELDIENSRNIKNKIKASIELFKQQLITILDYKYNYRILNNNKFYNIGIDYLNSTDAITLISPYSNIRDNILGITDLKTKYIYINKFINKFTREPFTNEDQFWLYCIDSGVKLLPSFYKDLYDGFFSNNYLDVLDQISKNRGEISDDGDKIIDKYSGYIIKNIDFVDEELYDDGFLSKRHDVMEQTVNTDELDLDDEAKMIKAIINALIVNSGIKFINIHEFIINNVKNVKSKIIMSETKYNSQVEQLRLKGKKIDTYINYYNYNILLITTAYFLIAVQTEPTNIKIKKSMLGCISSLSGYPIENNDDFSGLDYCICIIKKIANDNVPWNTIKRKKVDNIKTQIINYIDKVIIKTNDVKNRALIKRDYLLNKTDSSITAINTIWNTFLPPLNKPKLNTINNITSSFTDILKNNVKSGSKDQTEQLMIIKSKILFFSLNIFNSINHIVDKENTLLKSKAGIPYLENFCCNDLNSNTTLDYFTTKDKNINVYNDTITNLNNLYNTITNYSKPPILFNQTDTKLKYPSLKKKFDEVTIYKAFIHFCKYNKGLPIDTYLLPICLDNTSSFNITDTIQDKIQILKSEGKSYNYESLIQLLNFVNKQHILHIHILTNFISNKQAFEDSLYTIKELDINPFEDNIINLFTELVDTTNITKQSNISIYNSLRKSLLENTAIMRNNTIQFIKSYKSSITNKYFKVFNDFITNFDNFNTINTSSVLTTNEETTLYTINFLHNCIFNMVNVFPYIIINKAYDNDFNIPTHWKLSIYHQKDIQNIFSKYYKLFEGFDGFTLDLFNYIKPQLDIIYNLLNNTPYISACYINNKFENSIFDDLLILELYTYYFFKVISLYISLINLPNTTIKFKDDFDDTIEEFKDEPIYQDFNINTLITKLISTFTYIFNDYKSIINFNKTTILNKVLKTKDTEKELMTTRLHDLTKEERELDSEMRKAALGKWNISLQKGLTEYVAETYDIETQDFKPFELDKDDNNYMSYDEYEAYDMSTIPEDGDIGEDFNYPYQENY